MIENKIYTKIFISRKENDESHSDPGTIGHAIDSESFIIVLDDFVATGNTIKYILFDLSKNVPMLSYYDLLCVTNDKDDIKNSNIVLKFKNVVCRK